MSSKQLSVWVSEELHAYCGGSIPCRAPVAYSDFRFYSTLYKSSLNFYLGLSSNSILDLIKGELFSLAPNIFFLLSKQMLSRIIQPTLIELISHLYNSEDLFI